MKPTFLRVAILAFMLVFSIRAQTIIQIASSEPVSFFVKSDGSLWRGDAVNAMAKWRERMQFLQNEMKQHPQSRELLEQFREEGKHVTSASYEPVDLIVSNGVTAAVVNLQNDVFFIKSDGSLWAMGNNEGGFLGDGTFKNAEQPIQIVPGGVTSVACGEDFTIFLKNDGSVWGFGWNGNGVLGDETEDNFVARPKQIIGSGVTAIAAGYLHSVFIKNDGSLWGMGGNGYGELGLGTNLNHTRIPAEIVASNVVSVAAAHGHTLFIKSDGSLWAMGLNDWGQIGDCTIDWPYSPKEIITHDVVAIAAGYSGSLFLKKDGSLWGMGINWGSDYGEGIEFSSKCPTQIFAANNSALVSGYYYNAQLKTCASIWAGKFNNTPTGARSAYNQTLLRRSITEFPDYNSLSIEMMPNGDVRLTYHGKPGNKYIFERSSSLASPNWKPLSTNTAPTDGVTILTNTPDKTLNNFWRIRSEQ